MPEDTNGIPIPSSAVRSRSENLYNEIFSMLEQNANVSGLQATPSRPAQIPVEYTWYESQNPQSAAEAQAMPALQAMTEPTQQPPQHKFPIGSIVKWNTALPGVIEHIRGNGWNVNKPLLKITFYTRYDRIGLYIRLGEIESSSGQDYEDKYFIAANAFEIQLYNQTLAELRRCVIRPAIGTVVKFLGKGSRNNKLAVVISEARDEMIKVRWKADEEIGEWFYNKFQIAGNQSYSFVPDMNNYCKCNHCNSLRIITSMSNIRDEKYCDSVCAELAGYEYCRNCGTWHRQEELIHHTRDVVCLACSNTYYHECLECNGTFNISVLRLNESGELNCGSCRTNTGKLIYSYDYKPSPIYNKMAYENTRYLGIELEIEVNEDDECDEMAQKIKTWLKQQSTVLNTGKKLDKLIYLKNDGSLENGIEIVFHPFTLKSLHKHFPIKTFLEFIDKHEAEVNERCGMHVHVSKEKISPKSLLNGKWFFYKCSPYLKKFSGRNDFNYCRFEDRPTNDPYRQEHGRRTALNIAGSTKTLEIRLFRATLDYKKFMANVQFSDAVVAYMQREGAAFLRTASSSRVWNDFIDYAKKDGRYKFMTDFILQKGIV